MQAMSYTSPDPMNCSIFSILWRIFDSHPQGDDASIFLFLGHSLFSNLVDTSCPSWDGGIPIHTLQKGTTYVQPSTSDRRSGLSLKNNQNPPVL